MSLQKRITFFNFNKIPFKIQKKVFVYALFVVLHVCLFNVNVAEWGDSYKILKSAEYIKRLDYPKDEKRPPLMAALIALRPQKVDPIFWGRVVVLVFSAIAFIVFDKLVSIYVKDEKYRLISLILFVLNPVYLYWSLRIMTDVPFSFFVLLVFYLLVRWKDSFGVWKSILLGFLCGLAILTRFEGYLLLFSLMIGVIFLGKELSKQLLKPKVVLADIFHSLKFLVPLGLTTLVTVLGWWLYRNPLDSKYLGEPTYRVYDLKMVWTYFGSLFYLFGFCQIFYFLVRNPAPAFKHFKQNFGISTFILLELILILVWPAAVPRLFVPIIPFLILAFVLCYEDFEKKGLTFAKGRKMVLPDIAILIFLAIFYAVSQYFLKLQFLVASRNIFVGVFILQIIILLALIKGKSKTFLLFSFTSLLVWSLSVIYLDKNIYTTIVHAAKYAAENLSGTIVYNDVSSISDWYLNQSGIGNNVTGRYYRIWGKQDLKFKNILDKHADYLLLTNEQNPYTEFNLDNKPYLTLIKDFEYNVKGTQFFAKIVKFNGVFYE
jgi:hypothetical protein